METHKKGTFGPVWSQGVPEGTFKLKKTKSYFFKGSKANIFKSKGTPIAKARKRERIQH